MQEATAIETEQELETAVVQSAGTEANSNDALMQKILELSAKVAEMSSKSKPSGNVKLNTANVFMCTGQLDCKGAIPKQQDDIATVLTTYMDEGTAYSEAEMLDFLEVAAPQLPSLSQSKQPLIRLLRYYTTTPINAPSRPNHWNLIDRGLIVKVG